MKCFLCNSYHESWESCKRDDDLGSTFNKLPRFEPPKLNFDPILPKYEPPSFEFKPTKFDLDPILPKYEPPSFEFKPTKFDLDPILPKYEPSTFEFKPTKFDLDPILPKYEPPSFEFKPTKLDPILPKYEPLPPVQVRDIGNNLIGYKDIGSNQIQPTNSMINNGLPLRVDGNLVRDTMGNLVGQMGPGNTMFPPPSFGPPKIGF